MTNERLREFGERLLLIEKGIGTRTVEQAVEILKELLREAND